MGTLFAGIIRAPMTSVFMIFETTQDYQILVPLMVANLLSFVISRRYQRTPVYHALLEQDGIHLPSPSLKESPVQWTARDVMGSRMFFVTPGASIDEAWRTSESNGQYACMVGARDDLHGIVRPERLAQAVEAGRGSEKIETLAEDPAVHTHPDHPVDVVLERFANTGGLLPVLNRSSVRQVEGVITLEDIVRFLKQRRESA